MAHRIFTHDKQQGITQAWHNKTEITTDLSLDNNWLRTWDLVPVPMEKRGQPSKWRILETSDVPDLEIGAPYNPDTFQPVSNTAFLDMVKASIGGTPHKLVSVGSIRNRGRIFASIELNGMEQFKAAGREFAAFLNFGNGHDKSSVLWVNTSNVCTVCDNTFTCNLLSVENKAAKGASQMEDDNLSISKRHTKNVILQLPGLATLIDKAVGVQAEFQLAMQQLDSEPITAGKADSLFAGFIGRNVAKVETGLSTRAKNTVNRLAQLFTVGNGNHGRTLADAFSAVTDYYSHESSGGENIDRQILSSEYGAGNQAKQDFWVMVQDTVTRESVIERGTALLAVVKV